MAAAPVKIDEPEYSGARSERNCAPPDLRGPTNTPFTPPVPDLEVQRSDSIGDPTRDFGEHGRQEALERSIIL